MFFRGKGADKNKRREPRIVAPWRDSVITAAERCQDELDLAQKTEKLNSDQNEYATIIKKRLDEAKSYAKQKGARNSIMAWLTGTDIEPAWAAIHEADELLFLVYSGKKARAQVPELNAAAKRWLKPTDPRFDAYRDQLQAMSKPSKSLDREQLRRIRQTVNRLSDDAHTQVRTYRNAVLAGTFVLTIVLILFWVLSRGGQSWVLSCKKGDQCFSVGQLELVGALGGLLSGITALRRLKGFSVPYGLPIIMALLKIPAGALTGLLGVLWMQSGILGALEKQEGTAIVAYAAFFGFGQEVFTMFADSRAKELLGGTKGETS